MFKPIAIADAHAAHLHSGPPTHALPSFCRQANMSVCFCLRRFPEWFSAAPVLLWLNPDKWIKKHNITQSWAISPPSICINNPHLVATITTRSTTVRLGWAVWRVPFYPQRCIEPQFWWIIHTPILVESHPFLFIGYALFLLYPILCPKSSLTFTSDELPWEASTPSLSVRVLNDRQSVQWDLI